MPEEKKGMEFGAWLRRKLLERRMTLAHLSREAGCDYTYLWRILNADHAAGRRYRRPSYSLTRRIGAVLDAPREALAAAGYEDPNTLDAARSEDRLARLEADAAQLRAALSRSADDGLQPRRLPRLGRVQAGDLREALEAPEGWEELPAAIAADADFVLVVRGESMYPTLQEGDLLCVKQSATAVPGQVVVAMDDEEGVTVKRFEMREGVPLLCADNPTWPRLRFRPGTRIVGVVTGSFRPSQVLNRRPLDLP